MSAAVSSADGVVTIDAIAGVLRPVSLNEVGEGAELMTRIDRKYVVRADELARLIERCGSGLAVLEIDGLRSFRYETVYFDTADHDSYLDAARDRRRRFKVRTRTYADSATCRLEVKQAGGRGETVKVSMPYDMDDRRRLNADALAFVAEHLAAPPARPLVPVLATSYRRTTLVDFDSGARYTSDAHLEMSNRSGRAVRLDGHVLVETKSMSTATPLDRELWAAHCRPVALSKFAVGMALMHPELPANKWHRTMTTYFADSHAAGCAPRSV